MGFLREATLNTGRGDLRGTMDMQDDGLVESVRRGNASIWYVQVVLTINSNESA